MGLNRWNLFPPSLMSPISGNSCLPSNENCYDTEYNIFFSLRTGNTKFSGLKEKTSYSYN